MRTIISLGVILSLTALAVQPSVAANVDRSLSKETVRILNSLPAGKPRSTTFERSFGSSDAAANHLDSFTPTQMKDLEARIAASNKDQVSKVEANILAAQRATDAKLAAEREVKELREKSGSAYLVTDAKSLALALKAIGQNGRGTLNIKNALPELSIRNMRFDELRIQGLSATLPVIQALNLENVSNITLRKLAIQADSRTEAAVRVSGASGVTMEDMTFSGKQVGYGGGLQVENSTAIKLSDSKFEKLSQAGRFINVADLRVENNTLSGLRNGTFGFANVRAAKIRGNAMLEAGTNASGLALSGIGSDIAIFANKDMSIALEGDHNGRPGVAYSKVHISGNLLTHAKHSISVGGADDVIIQNNSAARINVGVAVMVRKAIVKDNIANSYQMQSKEAARWTGATEDVGFAGNRLSKNPVLALPSATPTNAPLMMATLGLVALNGKPVLAATAR